MTIEEVKDIPHISDEEKNMNRSPSLSAALSSSSVSAKHEKGRGTERSAAVCLKMPASPETTIAASFDDESASTVLMIISGDVPQGSPIERTVYVRIQEFYHKTSYHE